MAQDGAAFTDITDPAEWAIRLAKLSTDVDAVRHLHVIGDKPKADANKIDLGNDNSVVINRMHTLNLIIRETGDTNYDAYRTIECLQNAKIVYVIGGVKMFVDVDETGLLNNDFIKCNLEIGDQASNNLQDAYEFSLVLTWKSKTAPERIDNPLA
jgi:hypothetical protein